jgi:hypothetical protein
MGISSKKQGEGKRLSFCLWGNGFCCCEKVEHFSLLPVLTDKHWEGGKLYEKTDHISVHIAVNAGLFWL